MILMVMGRKCVGYCDDERDTLARTTILKYDDMHMGKCFRDG